MNNAEVSGSTAGTQGLGENNSTTENHFNDEQNKKSSSSLDDNPKTVSFIDFRTGHDVRKTFNFNYPHYAVRR